MLKLLPSLVDDSVLQHMVSSMRTTPGDGCIVEVGTYKGGSLSWLSAHSEGRPVFSYDTFTGIPYKDDIDSHRVGDFDEVDFEKLKRELPSVTFVKGVFPDSAISMPLVSFAHIDCDQYRAVKESAEYLAPMMLPGGIMWFDDYGCLAGAIKAVDELFGSRVEKVIAGKGMVRF